MKAKQKAKNDAGGISFFHAIVVSSEPQFYQRNSSDFFRGPWDCLGWFESIAPGRGKTYNIDPSLPYPAGMYRVAKSYSLARLGRPNLTIPGDRSRPTLMFLKFFNEIGSAGLVASHFEYEFVLLPLLPLLPLRLSRSRIRRFLLRRCIRFRFGLGVDLRFLLLHRFLLTLLP